MPAGKYILDTHYLIWFQENNPKIPARIMDIIQHPDNIVFFSQVSLFEIAIKKKLGKLPDLIASIAEIHEQALKDEFTFLQIQNQHISAYQKIPLYDLHRDPFDRLLIATAHQEDAIMISVDKNFDLYEEFIKVLG